ncbi:hypothetical protein PGTUg99_026183 [Puccinia graminis f. sp. tritici]|uniref:NADH dehydrogenase (Ubiquinone) 1 beta subcomplex 8 n=1 Tax=Puccinia graminis f. sp. tritici TaxID=56615 RepID=A0A5B0RVT3_PUCGR|nr:hypothetical protein PGTUg99_026183 [Puccinia graminis f. sp. tritici]
MAHLPLSRALRTSKNLLNSNISRRAYASASPQLISPTNEISVPPQRTAYEYKPLDEPDPQLDGLGYPRVESLSRQWRNPYAKWDDPQERCNFNEPLHAEEEMMGIWAPDVHRISVPSALINLAVAFTGLGVILVSAAYMAPSSPVVSRLRKTCKPSRFPSKYDD